MRLLFLRHAEASYQADPSIVVGRADAAPLTETGQAQAARAAEAARGWGLTAIHASTLRRALDTAGPMGAAVGLPVIVNELLVERSQGDFEGLKKDDVYTPERIKVIHADQWRWRPPNGESLEDAAGRLERFLDTLPADPAARVLVVTHLMVLWAMFRMATGCDHAILPHLRVDNAAVVEIDRSDTGGLKLLRWNAPVSVE